MHIIETPAYRKAFIQYLRRGTPLDISLKAMTEDRPTTHYIWRTQGDDKVRPEHAAREGQVFAWDDPAIPPPGTEYGCRCTATPYPGIVDPPIEPVYPELLLLPLFRIGRLLAAWRTLGRQRATSRTWKLGSHKTPTKWRNRLEKGDWTPEKITRTIREGKAYPAPNKVNKPNPATRYELDGNYIVVDDVTKEILQVSEPGYIPNNL